MEKSTPDGIFQISARRCRRCGGLLTSEAALRDGVGHVCKMREKEEEDARRWEEENQYSLFTPPEKIEAARRGRETRRAKGIV